MFRTPLEVLTFFTQALETLQLFVDVQCFGGLQDVALLSIYWYNGS